MELIEPKVAYWLPPAAEHPPDVGSADAGQVVGGNTGSTLKTGTGAPAAKRAPPVWPTELAGLAFTPVVHVASVNGHAPKAIVAELPNCEAQGVFVPVSFCGWQRKLKVNGGFLLGAVGPPK